LAARIDCRITPSKTRELRKSLFGPYAERQRGLPKIVFQLAVGCLVAQSPSAAIAKEVRLVLIVHSLSFSSPASVLGDAQFHAVLENSPYQIELYEETLQNILFSDPAPQQEVRQGWHNEDRVNHAEQAQEFSGQKIDQVQHSRHLIKISTEPPVILTMNVRIHLTTILAILLCK
jgi:hypothetical protein